MSKFKVGDIVRLVDQEAYGGAWRGNMEVIYTDTNGCSCNRLNLFNAPVGYFDYKELTTDVLPDVYFVFYKREMKCFSTEQKAITFCEQHLDKVGDKLVIMIKHKTITRNAQFTIE